LIFPLAGLLHYSVSFDIADTSLGPYTSVFLFNPISYYISTFV
jgi:hypothetical protein